MILSIWFSSKLKSSNPELRIVEDRNFFKTPFPSIIDYFYFFFLEVRIPELVYGNLPQLLPKKLFWYASLLMSFIISLSNFMYSRLRNSSKLLWQSFPMICLAYFSWNSKKCHFFLSSISIATKKTHLNIQKGWQYLRLREISIRKSVWSTVWILRKRTTLFRSISPDFMSNGFNHLGSGYISWRGVDSVVKQLYRMLPLPQIIVWLLLFKFLLDSG